MTTPVNFSVDGPGETVLPEGPADVLAALAGADREAAAATVAANPRLLDGWARLGALAEATAGDMAGRIEAYAYYRIGYHRGLDALRQNGWRGTGFVRWRHASNRGFLRCLDGLGRMAGIIDEDDEQQRCAQFLRQLDPDWPPDAD